MSITEEVHFLIPETISDVKDNFFAYYKVIKNYSDFSKKEYVGSDFVCRYCGETNRKSFKKDNSHTFPECTGNKWLFSKDECINCNQHFSLYENELANHGHVMRTFLGLKTKKGASTKYKTEAFKIQRLETGFVMNVFDKTENKVDTEKHGKITLYEDFVKGEGGAKINIPQKKFIPYYLFKCLAKIGLSIMPDSEMKEGEFDKLKHWLLSSEIGGEEEESPYFYAYYCRLPFAERKPLIQLYRREEKYEDMLIPKYSLYFAYGNDMFQIFLPHCQSDDLIYKGNTVKIPVISYFVGKTGEKRGFKLINGNIKVRSTAEGYKTFVF